MQIFAFSNRSLGLLRTRISSPTMITCILSVDVTLISNGSSLLSPRELSKSQLNVKILQSGFRTALCIDRTTADTKNYYFSLFPMQKKCFEDVIVSDNAEVLKVYLR